MLSISGVGVLLHISGPSVLSYGCVISVVVALAKYSFNSAISSIKHVHLVDFNYVLIQRLTLTSKETKQQKKSIHDQRCKGADHGC